MGHEVQVESEDGQLIKRIDDGGERLHRLLPPYNDKRFCLARFIDLYGQTVFNRAQMDTLIEELERLVTSAKDDQDQLLLSTIREMAEYCKKHPHTYLRFIGD